MSTAALVLHAVEASLALMVLGVGLQSTTRDATYLLRHRSLLARSIISMSVLMPLLALALTWAFSLHPVVALTLVALTLSPIPPFLPSRVIRAGGDGSYMIGLFVAASLAAIIVVPLSVTLIGLVRDVPLGIRPAAVATLVGRSVLVPLAIGVGVHHLAPSVAARAAKPIALVATVVLIAAFVPLLGAAWPAMRSLIGNGTLTAIVVIALAGVGIGHLLGGPEREDRTVLALATAMRHPAVAIAILTTNFPDEKLVKAAVILALIAAALATMPYTIWSKRRNRAIVERHLPVRTAA